VARIEDLIPALRAAVPAGSDAAPAAMRMT
jgi:hypothetical protein